MKEACDSKSQAQALLDAADQEFRSRVIAASKIGCSLDQIASAAGISKTRVHQIVRGK